MELPEPVIIKGRYPTLELCGLGMLFAWLYYATLRGLILDWHANPMYSHGYLIVLFSAYLLWERRSSLTSCLKVPSWAGLLILILGLVLFFSGATAEEDFVERVSLPLTLFGLPYFLCGREVARLIWFPVAYLYIMIPLPHMMYKAITLQLRLFNAEAVVMISRLCLPIYREGWFLHLPGITLEISDGCSGIFSVVGLTALGIMYVRKYSFRLRVVLLLLLFPIAVLTNLIRLLTMVFVCHYSGEWIVGSFLHEVSGIPMFLLGIVMLAGLGAVLERIPFLRPAQ